MKIAQIGSRVVSALFAFMFVFCGFAYGGGEMIDKRDGKKYKTVIIGFQVWMAENLNYVPKSGNSWCYENKESNCKKYGRLYDWKTALSVCPQGWHLPSDGEWNTLATSVGGTSSAGGRKLKAGSGWNNKDDGSSGNGTDDYGFSALPGGYRDHDGSFYYVGDYGYWWSATEDETVDAEYDASGAYNRYLLYSYADLYRNYLYKGNGFSVRCLRAPTEREAKEAKELAKREAKEEKKRAEAVEKSKKEMTDERDGKKYKTVTIGSQTWMAENLNYVPSNGSSWCYENKESNCEKYGRLYDWNTALTVCPQGWHLPSNDEWNALEDAIGGAETAGNKLKSKSGWNNKYDGSSGNGTDDYGFSALPGGYRIHDGSFSNVGYSGFWWSATELHASYAYYRYLDYYYADLSRINYSLENGFSVRCLRD